MSKFTTLELELFAEHTCSRCFHPAEAASRIAGRPHGCPLLRRAFDKGQMPGRWTRRRNAALGETFKCEDYLPRAASTKRKTLADNAQQDVLFADLDPGERALVPVEGWPDYRALARKSKEGDHQ
jgi:hypothetical protein